MLTVNTKDVMLHKDGTLSAEAAELGLAPGESWPDFIAVHNASGNGLLFLRMRTDSDQTVYQDRQGRMLKVFND